MLVFTVLKPGMPSANAQTSDFDTTSVSVDTVSAQKAKTLEPVQEAPKPMTPNQPKISINTPIISIDLIMDLYDRDIDFDIEYSGKAISKFLESLPKKKRAAPGEDGDEETEATSKKNVSELISETAQERRRQIMLEPDTSKYSQQDADYNKAMVSLNNAQKNFSDRRYNEALREINRSIESAKNIALAHAVKGSVLFMLRDMEGAKKSWERALELDPTMDNVRAILLRMY